MSKIGNDSFSFHRLAPAGLTNEFALQFSLASKYMTLLQFQVNKTAILKYIKKM